MNEGPLRDFVGAADWLSVCQQSVEVNGANPETSNQMGVCREQLVNAAKILRVALDAAQVEAMERVIFCACFHHSEFRTAWMNAKPVMTAVESMQQALEEPLSGDDVALLCEMYDRNVDADNPQTTRTIFGWLNRDPTTKRGFDNLKKFGYVKSAKKLGFCLTELGKARARKLSG